MLPIIGISFVRKHQWLETAYLIRHSLQGPDLCGATASTRADLTSRQIRFAEAWTDSQTQSFNLTAGILELNDQDKSKSTGVLYPAAQLILDKQGELQWDLNQNPWRLSDIIDWKGTPGLN